MVKENCGVVGIFSLDETNVIPMIIDSLRALQHRGQEAWGLAIPNKPPLKKIGLVSGSSSEFKKIAEEYSSNAAIGHVRYSTIGKSSLENAQPLNVCASPSTANQLYGRHFGLRNSSFLNHSSFVISH